MSLKIFNYYTIELIFHLNNSVQVPSSFKFLSSNIVPHQASRNSNTRQVSTLNIQTRLNSSLKKPEKLVLFELKLEILEQKSSMIHV